MLRTRECRSWELFRIRDGRRGIFRYRFHQNIEISTGIRDKGKVLTPKLKMDPFAFPIIAVAQSLPIDQMIDGAVTGLTQSYVPMLLTGSIVLWSLSTWLFFRTVKIGPVFHSLRKGIAILKKTSDPASFTEKFEEISQELTDVPIIGRMWTHYSEGLLLPSRPGQAVRTPSRSARYFNDHLLSEGGVNMRFYTAVPNYLVGIGLFCTFLGLFAALHLAAKGLQTENPAEMSATLRALLQAASFKFITSLAGLACSLVFSWRLKHQLHRFSNMADELCRAFDSRIVLITPERLAQDSIDVQERQTEELQRFNTDLAVSITRSFSESFPTWIAPVTNAIAGLANQMGSMNQDALGKMAQEFQEKLQSGTQDQFQNLAKTLECAQQSLQGISENVGRSGTTFGERFEQAAHQMQTRMDEAGGQFSERIQSAVENLQQSLEGVSGTIGRSSDELEKKFTEATDSMKMRMDEVSSEFGHRMMDVTVNLQYALQEVTDGIKSSVEPMSANIEKFEQMADRVGAKVSSHIEEFDASIAAMSRAVDRAKTLGEELDRAATPVSIAAEGMSGTSENLAEMMSKMEQAYGHLTTLISNMASASQASERTWDAYKQRFEQVDRNLEEAFTGMTDGFENYRIQIESFTNKLEQNLSIATQRLGGGVGELQGVVEELQETLERFADEIKEARESDNAASTN